MPLSKDAARSLIVDAAAALLREGGAQAVTTRAVAQAAGVQAPVLYRLFGDKDGLLDAVAEHVMAQWVQTKMDAAADDDPDPLTALRTGWQLQIDFGLANPDLYALLNAPERRHRSPATNAGIEILSARVRRLAVSGQLRVSEQRAVEMIHAAGAGAVLTLLASPADERDPGLADALYDAVVGTITTTAPAPPASDALALAVTFAAAVPDLPTLRDTERALLADWVARTIDQLQR